MRLAGCLKKGTNDRRTKNSRYYKYEVTKPQPNVIERVIPPSTRQHTCNKWIGPIAMCTVQHQKCDSRRQGKEKQGGVRSGLSRVQYHYPVEIGLNNCTCSGKACEIRCHTIGIRGVRVGAARFVVRQQIADACHRWGPQISHLEPSLRPFPSRL